MYMYDLNDVLNEINMSLEFIDFVESKEFIDCDKPFSEELFINEDKSISDKQRLLITLYEIENLYNFYLKNNIPFDIFYDSLKDFKMRVDRYYNEHNAYGLSAHDIKWLGYVFRLETFKIGSLKFRKYPLTYLEIERSGLDYMKLNDKVTYFEGLNVVYVHIERDSDIRTEAVVNSFKMANEFFSKYFSEYEYDLYVCRTWFLYPKLEGLLPDYSNMIKFKNLFEIVAEHNQPHQSLSRIYGTDNINEINKMEKTTTLSKIAYNNLDKLGVGFGVVSKEKFK